MVRLDQLKRSLIVEVPILLAAKAKVPNKENEGKRLALAAPIASD